MLRQMFVWTRPLQLSSCSSTRTAKYYSAPVRHPFSFNRRKIAELSTCLAISCALLAAEVILWTISLIG